VDDLHAEVTRLRAAGLQFRNEVTGPGSLQILLQAPSGNFVELYQPAKPKVARLAACGPRQKPPWPAGSAYWGSAATKRGLRLRDLRMIRCRPRLGTQCRRAARFPEPHIDIFAAILTVSGRTPRAVISQQFAPKLSPVPTSQTLPRSGTTFAARLASCQGTGFVRIGSGGGGDAFILSGRAARARFTHSSRSNFCGTTR
jgi:hypothetical protein